jgi:hypothetical protein
MQVIDMKVQYVELCGAPINLLQHDDMTGKLVDTAGTQSQRFAAAGNQVRCRNRITTGEQRHLMTLPNQLLR